MLLLTWILSSPLALAQSPEEPTSNVAPCPGVEESLDTLEQAGLRHAYDCVAEDDEALAPLLARIAAKPEQDTLTRALAVWRMQRLDQVITDEESRAYNAADRRLMTDAVKASKGRKSAVPAHVAVFEKMSWYTPSETYTDGRLDETDRKNLDLLREPAPLPEPDPEPEPASPELELVEKQSGCGCASSPTPGGLLGVVALVGLAVFARRRGDRARA